MMLYRLLFLAALLTAAPALAQTAPPAQPSTTSGERLLMMVPQNWTPITLQKSDKMVVTRLYPPGQTEQSWTEILTIQMYPGSDQTPRQFMEGVVQHSVNNCVSTGPGPVSESTRNGYPIAIMTVACSKGKTSGQGSVVMVEGIRGRDALYIVQRQWRGAAFGQDGKPSIPQEVLNDWAAFAKSVSLCDTRDGKHPCQ